MRALKVFICVFALSAVALPTHVVWADTADTSEVSDCGDSPVHPESADGIQDAWSAWTSCKRKYHQPRIDKVQTASELLTECSEDFFSMTAVEDCLVEKVRASEVTLQQAEKKLRAAMDNWDEWDKFVRLAKRRLTVSNKVFVMYREAMCSLDHSMGGGGFHLSMRKNSCIAEQNNRRAEQLLELSASIRFREESQEIQVSTLRQTLAAVEGRFDWLPEQNTYDYTNRQELSAAAQSGISFSADFEMPAARLVELVDCLDDTTPSASTFNDQPAPLGWVCHAALTEFVYPEETGAKSNSALDWVGNLKLPASEQTMREVKAAWQQVIARGRYNQ
jgi:uncharacterized protein YecT (DUF1311 family)